MKVFQQASNLMRFILQTRIINKRDMDVNLSSDPPQLHLTQWSRQAALRHHADGPVVASKV
jgi:hypothetical protein